MSRILRILVLGLGALLLPAEAVGDPDLVFSTFLGGSGEEEGTGIAVDGSGHVWVAGFTAPEDSPADVFVARFDPSGRLLWTTTFGGPGRDEARALTLDRQGNLYIAGFILPEDPAAPLGQEAFAVKLDRSGALIWSVLLGGSGSDAARDIAVDATGAAWVVGETDSPDFPRVGSLGPPPSAGFPDAFIVKIGPAGSALAFSTLWGGSFGDRPVGVAVDGQGRVHIAGTTDSQDFPTHPATPVPTPSNAFLLTLTRSGALVRSVILGGNHNDFGWDVAADAAGHAFVFGDASSMDFPRRGAFQPAESGFFLSRFDAAGNLVSSLQLGDLFYAADYYKSGSIALDPRGTIHLAGFADFPGGARLLRLDPGITRILDTLVLAGTFHTLDREGPWALATDARGGSYLTGMTHSPDFPTRNPAQPVFGGWEDAFVARIAAPNRPPDCARATASPDLLWPPNGKLRAVAIRGITDPDGGPLTLTVTRITQDEFLSKPGQPDATGVGGAQPMVRADRMGSGDGRVYHLTFTARDPAGNACTGRVTVCVPHDQGRPACRDGGARFDSTGLGN